MNDLFKKKRNWFTEATKFDQQKEMLRLLTVMHITNVYFRYILHRNSLSVFLIRSCVWLLFELLSWLLQSHFHICSYDFYSDFSSSLLLLLFLFAKQCSGWLHVVHAHWALKAIEFNYQTKLCIYCGIVCEVCEKNVI